MDNCYRAKSLNSGEWIQGQYLFKDWIPYIISAETREHIPIVLETVSYFCCLHRKTGESVWENDIFEFNGQKYVLQYFVDAGYFMGVSITSDKVLVNDIINIIADCKIIGNIFDNFELIAEGEQENVDRRK